MNERFRVLSADNEPSLQAQVNKSFAEGFVLHGDLKIVSMGGCKGIGQLTFIQAMERGELSAALAADVIDKVKELPAPPETSPVQYQAEYAMPRWMQITLMLFIAAGVLITIAVCIRAMYTLK